MKKSKAETAKTRQRIVEAAAEAVRLQGIDATGVAEVMKAAGLSHGGFYRHFDSKEALMTEALAMGRKNFVVGLLEAAAGQGHDAVLQHFQDYVSCDYRDDIGGGCPFAANGSEIVRADGNTRHEATGWLRTIFETAAPFMEPRAGETKMETAINLMTGLIGALTMARMVDDPELSERILRAARKRISDALGTTPRRRSFPRGPLPDREHIR